MHSKYSCVLFPNSQTLANAPLPVLSRTQNAEEAQQSTAAALLICFLLFEFRLSLRRQWKVMRCVLCCVSHGTLCITMKMGGDQLLPMTFTGVSAQSQPRCMHTLLLHALQDPTRIAATGPSYLDASRAHPLKAHAPHRAANISTLRRKKNIRSLSTPPPRHAHNLVLRSPTHAPAPAPAAEAA